MRSGSLCEVCCLVELGVSLCTLYLSAYLSHALILAGTMDPTVVGFILWPHRVCKGALGERCTGQHAGQGECS